MSFLILIHDKAEKFKMPRKKAIFEDIWFILWDLFPFALGYFCFFYLMHQWSNWILAIDAVLVPNALEKRCILMPFGIKSG